MGTECSSEPIGTVKLPRRLKSGRFRRWTRGRIPTPAQARRGAQDARRDVHVALATRLMQQNGPCPICRQVIPCDEGLEWHHRDDHPPNHPPVNLRGLPPHGHRQVHDTSKSQTE
jgi:hypothetical protein